MDEFYLRHPRMPLSERAKIFIPFEPLKGFREALDERERRLTLSVRPELSDERGAELSRRLADLGRGDAVVVRYHAEGETRSAEGPFLGLDEGHGLLLVGSLRAPLASVVGIEGVRDLPESP